MKNNTTHELKRSLSAGGRFPIEWGIAVADLRKSLDMTQTDLAKAVGVDLSTISRIETGAVRASIHHMAMISHHLKTTPAELFPLPTSGDIQSLESSKAAA